MNSTLMADGTGRRREDVNQGCPGSKAEQPGLSRDYKVRAMCLSQEVLDYLWLNWEAVACHWVLLILKMF